MAEGIFKDIVQQKCFSQSIWHIKSAGCWALSGHPATPTAVLAMRERGIDLAAHRSQPVTEALLAANDLILCMEFDHRNTLRRNFPEAADKVFLLSEITGCEQEVLDPVGDPLNSYLNTADKMTDYLLNGLQEILRLTEMQ